MNVALTTSVDDASDLASVAVFVPGENVAADTSVDLLRDLLSDPEYVGFVNVPDATNVELPSVFASVAVFVPGAKVATTDSELLLNVLLTVAENATVPASNLANERLADKSTVPLGADNHCRHGIPSEIAEPRFWIVSKAMLYATSVSLVMGSRPKSSSWTHHNK